jgi:superfamily II DNA/RNA helicase
MLQIVIPRLGAKLLAEAISKRYPHLRTTFIHGEMSGPERDRVRLACQQQEVDVVVATGGLWSRGMDFPHIRLVINFDMPTQVSEYIHQAGRASRLDVAGHVISFINDVSRMIHLSYQH